MSAAITRRVHQLANTLAELKVTLRQAVAIELAAAVGTAVRDVLLVALMDPTIRTPVRPNHFEEKIDRWRDDAWDHDRGNEPPDPWANSDDIPRDQTVALSTHNNRDRSEPMPAVSPATAVAVGVNVGQWWLARKGTVAMAVGFGVLTTALSLMGGCVARAVLAVLVTVTDLLTAESTPACLNLS